jgi:putative hydrolase of the HAD superfamily
MTVLVLDVDGVVVLGHPDGGRWDRSLERDLGIAPESLQEKFFRRHWRDIATGTADMLPVLESIWHELECSASPRAFIEYWFACDSRLNQQLLVEVDAWRVQGNRVFLATDQEHLRAKHLWEVIGLNRRFDGMHYSAALGAAKPDVVFFERVQARLPVNSVDEVVFLDDSMRNVEEAAEFGWRSRHFTHIEDLRQALSNSG